MTLPEAARRLGVSVRVLRTALRAGKLPSLPDLGATTPISAEWLAAAETAIEAAPKTFSRAAEQKAPAFVRYEGTSAWRKYSVRVREFAEFRAGQA